MHDLAALLPYGAARRSTVAGRSSAASVQRWLRRGDIVELHPGVVALRQRSVEWSIRARAALLWSRGTLSHGSALVAHGLLAKDLSPIHVIAPARTWPRDSSPVIVHRHTADHQRVRASGLPATTVATALVDAWTWASVARWNPRAVRDMAATRHALIEAVREGTVGVTAVRAASAVRGGHPGCRGLANLLDLLASGCGSELEIFGVLRVLNIPGLPPYQQQVRLRLPDGRLILLDAAWVAARVVVEMDGHRFHSSRADRERDMRRDTALAALGWVVLRFSYERLTTDPDGCRQEIAAAVRHRLAAR